MADSFNSFRQDPGPSVNDGQADVLLATLRELAESQKATNLKLTELTTVVRNIHTVQSQAMQEADSSSNFFVQMGTVFSWTLAALPALVLVLVLLAVLWFVFGIPLMRILSY